MIELAARVWNTEITATILQLQSLGVEFPASDLTEEGIESYIEDFHGFRKLMQEFWEKCQTEFYDGTVADVRSLRNKFAAEPKGSRTIWERRVGKFIGACHHKEFVRLFQPGRFGDKKKLALRPNSAWQAGGSYRLFKGHSWKGIIVLPFYDMPGRVCGFFCVGRQGEQDDITFRPIHKHKDTNPPEAGLFMYDAIRETDPAVYVFMDPMVAVKQQVRWLSSHDSPLPIVGCYSKGLVRPRQVWENLPKRDYIFWNTQVTPELIDAARRVDGRIVIAAGGSTPLARYFRSKPPQAWLKQFSKTAKPWQQVLADYLINAPLPEAETMIIDMEMTPSEQDLFLDQYAPALRERFETAKKPLARRVQIAGKTVKETLDGWYTEAKKRDGDHEICNAILRIEKVVHQPINGKTYYQGHVRYKGEDIPFVDDMLVVEKNPLQWMKDFLLKEGKGLLRYDKSWGSKALMLSQHFNDPEYVQGAMQYGWESEKQRFSFPGFSIATNGKVEEYARAAAVDPMCPAQGLQAPQKLNKHDLGVLSENDDGTLLFWATASCVIANILAPVFGKDPKAIGSVGKAGTEAVTRVAKMLGCVSHQLSSYKPKEFAQLSELCSQHAWPLVLEHKLSRKDKLYTSLIEDDEPGNYITQIDWFTARILTLRGGWYLVESFSEFDMTHLNMAGHKVLPAYLQWLCENRFEFPKQFSLRSVNQSLQQWFKGQDGDTLAIERSQRDSYAISQEDTSQAFIELVGRLYLDGDMKFDRDRFVKDREGETIIHFPGSGIWIPKAALSKIIAKMRLPLPDGTVITKALAESGALIEECDRRGGPGWLLQEEPWDTMIKIMRARRANLVKKIL
jgi:ribosomal protein S17E